MTRPLWFDTMSSAEWGPARPTLDTDTTADVVIVGGGFSGLWTAYYLLRLDPTIRVVVLEAEHVGFGASGRNGGWCSALLPMTVPGEPGLRMQRAMHDTVAEVGRVTVAEGIECDFAHGGYVALARSARQLALARAAVAESRALGLDEHDHRLLDRHEATALCAATDVVGGTFTPHCAAVHPAKLARGLARVVESLGGTVYERTRALDWSDHVVQCEHAMVRAEVIVRATEAFTPRLASSRRVNVPVYSLMVATEPLPDAVWNEIGLAQRSTFNDLRHNIVYGQRTADGRLAFGGRGAWYHWGSTLDAKYEGSDRIHALIADSLRVMFPSIGDAAVTHRWGGAVAAARDLWCHVAIDRQRGVATLGNYLGDGVGTSNLAGHTLADLIVGVESERTTLAFVDHHSRRWEPEPLRFIGVNAAVAWPLIADLRPGMRPAGDRRTATSRRSR